MATETTAPPPAGDLSFFGHPRGLATLFFTEMGTLLVLRHVRAARALPRPPSPTRDPTAPDSVSTTRPRWPSTAPTPASCICFRSAAAGLRDRLIGPKRTVLWGGIIIALGHYSLAVPVDWMFWLGLLLIAGGTGLLPNISAMVGDLYATRTPAGTPAFDLLHGHQHRRSAGRWLRAGPRTAMATTGASRSPGSA